MPDVNGDGYADLLVGVENESAIQVFSGSSMGVSAVPTATVRLVNDPSSAHCAGDLDGDGFVEIVATTSTEFVMLRSSVSGLTSVPIRIAPTGTNLMMLAISELYGVGDFNGDGYGDVVWTDAPSNNFSVLTGGPAGATTSTRITSASGVSPFTTIAVLGDINGDGLSDFALEGGLFGARVDHVYLGRTGTTLTPERIRREEPCGVFPIGDINLDGFADLLCTTASNRVLYLGSAAGWRESAERAPLGDSLRFHDLNGDGNSEWWNDSRVPSVIEFVSTGTFPAYTIVASLPDPRGTTRNGGVISPGDIDGNGFDDLVVATPSQNAVHVYSSTRNGPSASSRVVLQGRSGSAFGAYLVW